MHKYNSFSVLPLIVEPAYTDNVTNSIKMATLVGIHLFSIINMNVKTKNSEMTMVTSNNTPKIVSMLPSCYWFLHLLAVFTKMSFDF